MKAKLPILRNLEHRKTTLTRSGITLDPDRLADALDGWPDEAAPLAQFDRLWLCSARQATWSALDRPGSPCRSGNRHRAAGWNTQTDLRAHGRTTGARSCCCTGRSSASVPLRRPKHRERQVTLIPHDVPKPVVQIRF
jgi:hypothetical protein